MEEMQIPEEQRVAIDIFKATGETQSFVRDGVEYVIEHSLYNGGANIAAWKDGESIGDCFTDSSGNHYGVGVAPREEGKGIGSILYETKQEVDGILDLEVSSQTGLISFYIKLIKIIYNI